MRYGLYGFSARFRLSTLRKVLANLRRATRVVRGDATVFFTKPVCGVLFGISLLLLLTTQAPTVQRLHEEALVE